MRVWRSVVLVLAFAASGCLQPPPFDGPVRSFVDVPLEWHRYVTSPEASHRTVHVEDADLPARYVARIHEDWEGGGSYDVELPSAGTCGAANLRLPVPGDHASWVVEVLRQEGAQATQLSWWIDVTGEGDFMAMTGYSGGAEGMAGLARISLSTRGDGNVSVHWARATEQAGERPDDPGYFVVLPTQYDTRTITRLASSRQPFATAWQPHDMAPYCSPKAYRTTITTPRVEPALGAVDVPIAAVLAGRAYDFGPSDGTHAPRAIDAFPDTWQLWRSKDGVAIVPRGPALQGWVVEDPRHVGFASPGATIHVAPRHVVNHDVFTIVQSSSPSEPWYEVRQYGWLDGLEGPDEPFVTWNGNVTFTLDVEAADPGGLSEVHVSYCGDVDKAFTDLEAGRSYTVTLSAPRVGHCDVYASATGLTTKATLSVAEAAALRANVDAALAEAFPELGLAEFWDAWGNANGGR